jgi:hypothetical protein
VTVLLFFVSATHWCRKMGASFPVSSPMLTKRTNPPKPYDTRRFTAKELGFWREKLLPEDSVAGDDASISKESGKMTERRGAGD